MNKAPRPESTPSLAYLTCEQQLALRHDTAAPYFRLDDGMCRSFLQSGVCSPEFESIRLLFPFVREAVVMRIPRQQQRLTDFLYFAFHAGNDLGARHPELLVEVLPDHELFQARRRLGVIKFLSEEELGTGRALYHAFDCVVQGKNADTAPECLDAVYAELALRSLRCGFAVATLAHLDPELCDFYGPTKPDMKRHFPNFLWRTWLGAPADAVGISLIERLEHPLLRVASQLYPGRPTECAVVQSFIREHLSECGAVSENDCPATDSDLMKWIAAGMKCGRRLQREQPATLQQIFAEVSGEQLADSISVVHEVVAEAGSLKPALLLPALKRWQKDVYGWGEPSFYGQSVERVALFADFSCWIPWGLSCQQTVSQDGQTSLEA